MNFHTRRMGVLAVITLAAAAAVTGSGEAVSYAGSGVAAAGPAAAQGAAGLPSPARWYKGNTHTHTINNGGDSTPDDVTRWYRSHGYQFLVITDHNLLTSVKALNALHGADEQFLVVPGEEVTSRSGEKPVHMNGLDIKQVVPAFEGGSVRETLQKNIDGIRAASGVPHINHPNFGWGLTSDDLHAANNYKLLEIFNGHPSVNNLGGGGVPGMEEVWDTLLSSGKLVYGIAVDDAHVFKDPGNPRVSGPGRGWVVVRSPRLEASSIMAALERGDFYASTGVVLEDVVATPTSVKVAVKPDASSKYRIQFIGRRGTVLSESIEPVATYRFVGNEGYVRAKVIESNGRFAWVQPVTVPSQAARMWDSVSDAVASLF